MNIVVFTDTFLPKIDGVGISVDHFSRLLAEKGHKFVICCPRYDNDDIMQIGENIHIIRFSNAPLPSYPDIKVVLPSQKKIHTAMTMFPSDLVHIQSPGLLGQYGVLAAKMYGKPLVGTYHTLVSEQDTYISPYRLLKIDSLLNLFKSEKKVKKNLDKVERKAEKGLTSQVIMRLTNTLYDQCQLIISPSHMIKKELVDHGVRTPIEVISNGMDLNQFRGEVKKAPTGAPKLLHVGRISYEKNVEVVLKAFALIQKQYPEATLDIYGDGPALSSMKIEAKQWGLDSVNFPGFVDRATLPNIYPKYDLFMTASTMETQGLVVLESMACGLPCVGVDSYALPELIRDGQNGFIVEPFHHIQMAESALKILQDSALYEKFSTRSLEISREHDIFACAHKLEDTYQRVAQSPKGFKLLG